MQYSTLLALLSAPLIALAQSTDNAFIIPDSGLSASADEPLDLNWTPSTDGTVTLVLRSGSSNDLSEGTVIASNIDNSGSFTWTPTNELTRGSDYAIQIVDDADPENYNFTPYFVLDTTNTVAQPTSVVSLGSATATPDLSTASPTGAATSLTDIESLVTSTASSAAATDASASTTASSGASASSSASDASASASDAASSASSSASDATESASASSDAEAPEQSGNGASKKTAMVGVLGAVALGAFAL